MSVSHRQLREAQSTVLESAQEREPAFPTFMLTALARQHDLLSCGEGAHDREECALAIRDARLHIEAIGPPVDDLHIRQIPFRPGLLFNLKAGR
ncbi:MAG: hypothetical protein R3B05_22180 [Nitrospira sp.]